MQASYPPWFPGPALSISLSTKDYVIGPYMEANVVVSLQLFRVGSNSSHAWMSSSWSPVRLYSGEAMEPLIVCLLLLYILATSEVISGRVPTCDSAHSRRLYSATQLGNQAVSTMTWYPTQSHYHNTDLTSPCPILIMPSTWLGSDKYQFDKSLILTRLWIRTHDLLHAKPVLYRFGHRIRWTFDYIPKLIGLSADATDGV